MSIYLQVFEKQEGKAFDPHDILTISVANVITKVAFGGHFDDTYEDFARFFDINEDLFKNVERNKEVFALDFFPMAKYFRPKAYQVQEELITEAWDIIRKQLQERKKMFDPETDEVHDLISALLKARHEAERDGDESKAAILTDDYIVNTVETMFSAGYDPTRWEREEITIK